MFNETCFLLGVKNVEDGKPEALMISGEIQILQLKVFENHVATRN